jgi:hypothetical protein
MGLGCSRTGFGGVTVGSVSIGSVSIGSVSIGSGEGGGGSPTVIPVGGRGGSSGAVGGTDASSVGARVSISMGKRLNR